MAFEDLSPTTYVVTINSNMSTVFLYLELTFCRLYYVECYIVHLKTMTLIHTSQYMYSVLRSIVYIQYR